MKIVQRGMYHSISVNAKKAASDIILISSGEAVLHNLITPQIIYVSEYLSRKERNMVDTLNASNYGEQELMFEASKIVALLRARIYRAYLASYVS